MSKDLVVCILAAGVGSRMHSDKPKVLQTLAGKPLLAHLLDSVEVLSPARIHVVVGQGAGQVTDAFSERTDLNWVMQPERLGTGHAVQQVIPSLPESGRLLILLGDAPLVRSETLAALASSDADLTVLTVDMQDPFNFGRIIRKGDRVSRIVEEKDADDIERSITEINTGVMAADVAGLRQWLSLLDNNNAQREYLITDIVEHANRAGCVVEAMKTDDTVQVTGINTFSQLSSLERALQHRTASALMDNGVQVMDPARLDIRGTLVAGRGSLIDINVLFEGKVTLGENVVIGPNTCIKDAVIGSGSVIKANSVIDGAEVGPNCSVGPFARLRPGTRLIGDVSIGNFVEVKKTTMGRGSKASHLTYLGDSTLGEEVNIGAGTITCNYDGVNKFETHIGDRAFIGSNASLVAPVSIGAGATVGAGSTISKDVPEDVLALGRGRQTIIDKWQRPVKK